MSRSTGLQSIHACSKAPPPTASKKLAFVAGDKDQKLANYFSLAFSVQLEYEHFAAKLDTGVQSEETLWHIV